nr:MAG TPA: hypothetical protein [Bacteriophage sp.]
MQPKRRRPAPPPSFGCRPSFGCPPLSVALLFRLPPQHNQKGLSFTLLLSLSSPFPLFSFLLSFSLFLFLLSSLSHSLYRC